MKLILLIIMLTALEAKSLNYESFYQERFCAKMNGKGEYLLPNKTRVDCLTDTHAIEVDFSYKFYEAIGQSLYYSIMTGKKAGIYLIIESEKDLKYLERLKIVAEKYNIEVYHD